jgi:hypothetical protein
MGLGRVKTPTCNLRVEIPSQFRQLENQKYLRPLLGEASHFRSTPVNGHHQNGPAGPFRANC